MFDARQEVENLDEDTLPGFIFRVPGVVLKTKGSDQVVFKLMRSKGGEGEEEIDLLKLMMSPAEKKKEEEQTLKKKTNRMRMRRDQIRVGLLRALRYSK